MTSGDRAMLGIMPNASELKYSIALKKQEEPRVKIQLGKESITIFDKSRVHKLLI